MSPAESPAASMLDTLAAEALHLITTAHHRWPPEALQRALASRFDTDRRFVRKALNRLLQTGEVQYTYEFGCSFLVPSVNRPVAVSRRVVLSPPGCALRLATGQVPVRLSHGAAFGTGAHPTTRLAVRAIDGILSPFPECWRSGQNRALDVGTGSGVLLLAALQLGMTEGTGIDFDPCALSEAKANAALNGLSAQTAFSDDALSGLAGRFRLITANLRMPTLMDMSETLTGLSADDARLVISGIREDEAPVLRPHYADAGWELIGEETETGWAGQAYRRDAAQKKTRR